MTPLPHRCRWYSHGRVPASRREPSRRERRRQRSFGPKGRPDGLVSALSVPLRVAPVLTAVLWLASALFFWLWWLAPGHQTTVAGLVINSAVLAFDLIVLPLWFFFFVLRMRRPGPALEIPLLSTAMVVTKAPSEPWELVRTTLEAMLAQDFPHPYDVWLADEQLADETIDWCAAHGVRMSTREGVAAYHRASWPRRTSCKEGNLAFFYDRWGYREYDVVAQLDADHVPARDYLWHMVAPFSDPRVGYVAAPSISRPQRRRLLVCSRTAVLRGCPARCDPGRTQQRLCPELHRLALRGAHRSATRGRRAGARAGRGFHNHPDPERARMGRCVRDRRRGPRERPRHRRRLCHAGLPVGAEHDARAADGQPEILEWPHPAAGFQLAGCQLWYPLYTLVMLVMLALPVWAVLAHAPLASVDVGAFYLHFAPVGIVMLGAALLRRHSGLLRPADAPVISWGGDPVPVRSLAVGADRLRARDLGMRDRTRGWVQGDTEAHRRRPAATDPGLVAIPVAVGCIDPPRTARQGRRAARGYYFWALLNGAIYLLVAVALVVLHIAENRSHTDRSMLRFASAKLPAIAAIAAALGLALVLHGRQALDGVTASAAPRPAAPAFVPPWPAAAPSGATVDIGVTTRPLASQAARPWTPDDLQTVNRFEQAAHKHASIVMWYADWRQSAPPLVQLQAVQRRGSTPEITWEPWDSTKGLYSRQPHYQLRNIIAGKFDSYISAWARSLAAWGKPVRLRLAQEMNGGWYPWSEQTNGNRQGEFVRAWRHVHDIFAAADATNVRWVWSPVSGAPREYFPGDRYVDVLGVTCLNGGTAAFNQGWRSFASICGNSIRQLHALAPKLPIELAEVGSAEAGGSKAAWINDLFGFLGDHPEVKSLVWFNLAKQADWPIDSSLAAQTSFAAGVKASRYK